MQILFPSSSYFGLSALKHPLCGCYAPWTIERSLCNHDEILLETPIEATDEVALILKETMQDAETSFLKTAPVAAEMVVVGTWSEN